MILMAAWAWVSESCCLSDGGAQPGWGVGAGWPEFVPPAAGVPGTRAPSAREDLMSWRFRELAVKVQFPPRDLAASGEFGGFTRRPHRNRTAPVGARKASSVCVLS